jgi:uncharacterized protein YegL
MDTNTLSYPELINNTSKRLPVVLCIDTSYSMNQDATTMKHKAQDGNRKIDLVNKGINTFFEIVDQKDISRDTVDLCIITFDSEAKVIRDFSNINPVEPEVKLIADGQSHIGKGLLLAVDKIRTYREELRKIRRERFHPWLIVMTDGVPYNSKDQEGENSRIKQAVDSIQKLVSENVVVWAVGLGTEKSSHAQEELALLRDIAKDRAVTLKDMKLNDLFKWLAESTVSTSQSSKEATTAQFVEKTSEGKSVLDILTFKV